MCPAHLAYVTEKENGTWTTEEIRTDLIKNDELTIFIMVEKDDEIFTATQNFKIDAHDKVSAISMETLNFAESCDEINANSSEITHKIDNITCPFSKTLVKTAAGTKFCEKDIIFEETFDDHEQLNLNHWSYDIRLRLEGSVPEFVVFDDKPKNLFIVDGILHMQPTVVDKDIRIRGESLNLGTRCTAFINPKRDCSIISDGHFILLPPVYSAQIHTRRFFSFMYGTIEIRAKLPRGDWILPYAFLQPASTLVDSEQVQQMRIAFARGNTELFDHNENIEIGGSRVYGGIYYWNGYVRENSTRSIKRDQHFGSDFHLYSLTWSESRISVAVDGISFGEITDNLEHFNEECFLVLGVSVGGHLEFMDNTSTGSRNNTKPWMNTSPKATLDFWKNRQFWSKTWTGDEGFKIDYVKVYAL